MTSTPVLDAFREAGAQLIAGNSAGATLIPLQQEGVVFRQMFEYPVVDFEAEAGFYALVFGFEAIALTEDYALFTHPENGYCLSFRKDAEATIPGLKLLLMTADIEAAEDHLHNTTLVPDRVTRQGSPVQRVISFTATSGLTVEIWEDPSPGSDA